MHPLKHIPTQRTKALVKQIVQEETKSGGKSINQLHEASWKYVSQPKRGKKKRVSRDTLARAIQQISDVTFQKTRGRKGFQVISKKNSKERTRVLQKTKEILERELVRRICMQAMIEGQPYLTLEDIYRELRNVGRKTLALKGEREKAWSKFLEKYYPNIEDPLEKKVPKTILKEFEEYYKKEYFENVDAEKKG